MIDVHPTGWVVPATGWCCSPGWTVPLRVSDLEAVDGTPVIDCKPEPAPLPQR